MPENHKDTQSPGAVGIDLGTTMSALGYVPHASREAKLVPNAEGQLLTPSAVLVTDSGVLVGQSALDSDAIGKDNFSECFKRHIGRAYLPGKLRGRDVPPEVLCGFLLEKLRRDASASIGPVRDAVITVPAFYGELHRTATQQAGRAAGLNVLNIINEPTAAAISFAYEQRQGNLESLTSKRILVYDFGGGTFDATVLEFAGAQFRTLSTAGDVMLGGRDIDEQIFEHLASQFLEAHDIDPHLDPVWTHKLWRASERLKCDLSRAPRATAALQIAQRQLNVTLTREEFEQLTETTVEQTLFTTHRALDDAGIQASALDLILLVGGSSRIPLITRRLQEETGVRPQLSNNPDEAVALGAALYAATFDEDSGVVFSVGNVNSHSLGIEGVNKATNEPAYQILIRRNSTLPARKSRKFPTNRDNQSSVEIRIREGENPNPQHNTLIGRCSIPLEPHSPKGTEIEVTFQYTADGTISVGARRIRGRQSARLEVRRQGVNNIDPLTLWAARLVTGEDLPVESHHHLVKTLPDNPVTDTSTPSELVARIHFLCSHIGILSLGDHLPSSVLAVQRQLKDSVSELKFFHEVRMKAKLKLETLEERATRSQMKAVIRRADLEILRVENQVLHLQIALGCGCAVNHYYPPGAEVWQSELNSLLERCPTNVSSGV